MICALNEAPLSYSTVYRDTTMLLFVNPCAAMVCAWGPGVSVYTDRWYVGHDKVDCDLSESLASLPADKRACYKAANVPVRKETV